MDKPAGYAAFSRALDGWETDDLLLAGQLVEDLRAHPGYEVVERLVTQRRESELTVLVHGPVVSKAQYAERTGRLSGMESALRAVEAVLYAAEVRERDEQAAAEAAQKLEAVA